MVVAMERKSQRLAEKRLSAASTKSRAGRPLHLPLDMTRSMEPVTALVGHQVVTPPPTSHRKSADLTDSRTGGPLDLPPVITRSIELETVDQMIQVHGMF